SEKYVLGLQIPMRDALTVCCRQSGGDLARILDRLSAGNASPVQPGPQSLALEQFVNNVRRAVVDSDIVNRQDVGVIESAGCESFLLEAPQPSGIAGEAGRQNFQRHVPVQAGVPRPVYFTHAAGADKRCDLVMPEYPPG